MGPVRQATAFLASGADNAATLIVALRHQGGGVGSLIVNTGAPWFTLDVSASSDRNRILRMEALREVTKLGFPHHAPYEATRTFSRTLVRGFEYAGYQEELAKFVGAIKGARFDGPTFADELRVYEAVAQIESLVSR
jgi:hypothetical protein